MSRRHPDRRAGFRRIGFALLLAGSLACAGSEGREPTLAPPSPTHSPPAISLQGSAAFVVRAQAALDLLASCAPHALRTVDRHMNAIQESDRSGMLVDTGVFLASSTTAFAPGYSSGAQIFWFAGAIVHDAHHSEQKAQGMVVDWSVLTLAQREAIEADARGVQIEVLEACLGGLGPADQSSARHMLSYLQDMQAGVIPCDYCAVEWENRDW